MRILVLCTGNSCRSQMMEGFLRSFDFDVQSAGLKADKLNKFAIQVMHEVNIDISQYRSKIINDIDLHSFDLLITVCDHAKETCPKLYIQKKTIHKSFVDPAKFNGDSSDTIAVFREVRCQIENFCLELRKKYKAVN